MCVFLRNASVYGLLGFNATLTKMMRFFNYLLTSMAAVMAGNVLASFLLVGDLNGHLPV